MKCALFIFLFASFSYYLSAQITFQKDFYIATSSNALCIKETNDKGYLIGGNIVPGLSWSDIAVIKTDSFGSIVWSKTINSPHISGIGGIDDVLETFTGDFLILGLDRDSTGSSLLVKLDSQGNLVWYKNYGVGWMHSLQQAADSGFYLCGDGCHSGIGLMKVDQNGDTVWTKTIVNGGDDMSGVDIINAYDGNLIIIGYVDPVAGARDIVLIKSDDNGNLIWQKKIGGMLDDQPFNIFETDDSSIVITGYTTSFSNGDADVFVITTDSLGNILWAKTYGGSDQDVGWSIFQDEDGEIVFGGETESFGNSFNNGLVTKIDFSGNVIWSNTFDNAVIESIIKTSDGGFAACGYNQSNYHMHFLKSDSLGITQCNELSVQIISDTAAFQESNPVFAYWNCGGPNMLTPISVSGCNLNADTFCLSLGLPSDISNNHFSISPNPVATFLKVETNSLQQIESIIIWNIIGEQISSSSFSGLTTVDCRLFPSGIYFVSLQTDKGISVQKFIKQ